MKCRYYIHENFLTLEEKNNIVKKIKQHQTRDIKDNPSLGKNANVDICYYGYLRKELRTFTDIIHQVNNDKFAFNLFQHIPDNVELHLTTYSSKTKGKYDLHIDGAKQNDYQVPKLTCILNVSDKPFKGGNFMLWGEINKSIDLISKPGSLLIFPSFLPHQVQTVKKGERKVLVYWARGPMWK